MNLTKFLQSAGLSHLVSQIGEINFNEFVDEAFRLERELSDDEEGKFYKYKVPKLAPDGSCSFGNVLEDKPYDLSQTYDINSRNSLWLWRLNQLVSILQQNTNVDWLGIYKKVKRKNSDEVLLKLTYYGEPSRAEFPLTKEFAAHSNNSTVGLNGKAILVQDLAEYKGPYYKCDGRVRSEFCCPIFNRAGEVIGIIDAESFIENFFDDGCIRTGWGQNQFSCIYSRHLRDVR